MKFLKSGMVRFPFPSPIARSGVTGLGPGSGSAHTGCAQWVTGRVHVMPAVSGHSAWSPRLAKARGRHAGSQQPEL